MFGNGQEERFFKNGKKEVKYPDGTVRTMENDREEIRFVDGTVQKNFKGGRI